MPLIIPQLDDRSYQDLLDDALARIRQDLNTDWNDLSAGDPGVVLLEAFAFLTEQMLYRLNRLPEKAYLAFLNLLGVSLYPPSAARASLYFWQAGDQKIVVPRGTRIVSRDGNDDKLANAFILPLDLEIPAASRDEATAIRAVAYHCERIEEELGVSNGMPGQSFTMQHPPLIALLGNWLDLVVGVEIPPEERRPGDEEGADGRIYRPWKEVRRFGQADLNGIEAEYVVDRALGFIQFAPAMRKKERVQSDQGEVISQKKVTLERQAVSVLGAVPPAGRHIRAWYSRGGGEAGNLPAHALNEILDVSPELLAAGVSVTNPQPAWGGADSETLTNAMLRGPHDFFSQGNVVTARDYAQLVVQSGSIARAKVYARASLWSYAPPGTVEIAMLPALSGEEIQSISVPSTSKDKEKARDLLDLLKSKEKVIDLLPLYSELNERGQLGTHSELVWARYKRVWVEAELLVKSGSDHDQMKKRLTEGLNRLISPFPPETQKSGSLTKGTASLPFSGWPFGQELRLAQLYQYILTSEPDITLVQSLSLNVEEAPHLDVHCLAADVFQPNTWYAASGQRLFRSMDDGVGWEKVLEFDPNAREAGRLYHSGARKDGSIWRLVEKRRLETVRVVCPSPHQPGAIAVATRLAKDDDSGPNNGVSALYVTANCGETWYRLISRFDVEIEDLAWLSRGNRHILLMATNCGLYELDVAFQAGDDGQLDGKPPAGPAPDANLEFMPHLAPVRAVHPTLPLYAVAVITNGGNGRVAVAAKNRQGVYLSRSDDLIPVARRTGGDPSVGDLIPVARKTGDRASLYELVPVDGQAEGGANFSSDKGSQGAMPQRDPGTNFDYLGLFGEDIRHLKVQTYNTQTFLWAAAMAVGEVGHGCYRWQFDVTLEVKENVPVAVSENWTGGSCYALAFQGPRVVASTAWGGILTADFDRDDWTKVPTWKSMGANFLPRRIHNLDQESGANDEELGRRGFAPLVALASNDSSHFADKTPILMTGGKDGVYRCNEAEDSFNKVSRTQFQNLRDVVSLPPNWLFVAGQHDVKVLDELASQNKKEGRQ